MNSNSYKIALWNANGLAQHCQDVKLFLNSNNLDILLVSETHFTDRSYFRLPDYTCYSSNHPDNKAHGGCAVIIRNGIKHYVLPNFQQDFLQACSVTIEDWAGPITLSAVYCPPRFAIQQHQFEAFFSTLGGKFLAGGDYNAKHPNWGSRLTTPRGRQLLATINANQLEHLSTGEPTYWPTDMSRIPDVLDIFITKGISHNYLMATSCLDLSSDHSPIIVSISSSIQFTNRPDTLHNKLTDWEQFRQNLNGLLTQKLALKTPIDLDYAVAYFNDCVQTAARLATPPNRPQVRSQFIYPVEVKRRVAERRRLRRIWQNSRHPRDKALFNRASQNLKRFLHCLKNQQFQTFTENLSATEATDYSLWRVTKNMKQPKQYIPPILRLDGTWAKSDLEKSEAFAEYFSSVFQPNSSNIIHDDLEILEYLDTPNQLELPIKPFTTSEVRDMIKNNLNAKKSPGYDLITGKILKELPLKGLLLLTAIFNAALRMEHFPIAWKRALVVVVLKPGKPVNQLTSYRPISLLPVASKLFEKLFLKRIQSLIIEDLIIPNHQFGFRQQHATVEQVHRVSEIIRNCLESKEYCSAAFLDVSQAFDKVWHFGLLYKIKKYLPHSCFLILRSYLSDRTFNIKFSNSRSSSQNVKSGVPQGSVLGPFLYLIFTADLPENPHVKIATFADDTAILSCDSDPVTASRHLQQGLEDIANWMSKWKIKVNETKSVQVTFTLRHGTCPPVLWNNAALPQTSSVKYLGVHLDEKLNWRNHIWMKRLQLNSKLSKMSWLLNSKSKLSLNNKILLYKIILKPIWTYGIQIWGTASKSNIDILQRFQSKVLRKIANAPWYVSNQTLHRDFKIPYVSEEISRFSRRYVNKLHYHPNHLALSLLDNSNTTYRLKRGNILDLPYYQ